MHTSVTDLFGYHRRATTEARVGSIGIGGANPIRIQSMTTARTTDTEGCVAQAERIVDAGGELVRCTTQGSREAENMAAIRDRLRRDGYGVPLVADVHFNPDVADVAARIVEKVRINPGNYVDPARRFIHRDYTDEEYAAEVEKIRQRLLPLLRICREHHTALRIGVNHGSLSDRIRCRYGDTPEGIVESCMEFLRVCRSEQFGDVVISIKSSNTVVMVRSVRLLVSRMEAEDMHYPLHLGVTEAGEGEDGRIKSAVGIGALLADGIGDTLRVSLTEAPEAEIPVARRLADHFTARAGHQVIPGRECDQYDWLRPERRKTRAVGNVGGGQQPVVIVSDEGREKREEGRGKRKEERGKRDEGRDVSRADFVYTGREARQGAIVDYDVYMSLPEEQRGGCAPIFPAEAMPWIGMCESPVKYLVLRFGTPAEEYLACLGQHPEVVVVAESHHQNRTGELRALIHEMWTAGVENPVVVASAYEATDKSDFQIDAAADMGALLIDGLADGLWLMNSQPLPAGTVTDTALGILQAARLRMSHTEYISCPGCGRTLYDLPGTIARIRQATSHLVGLKIGIMGCIVNGPGEMADADYGYVGAGPGRVSLYRRQECVEKNIPEAEAVDHLLALIERDKT